MSKSLKIACIGEAMLELCADAVPGPSTLNVAGDTMNTAVYLRRGVSCAHQVSYVTRLGHDAFSDQMIGFMSAEDLDVSLIEKDDDRLPGLYAISVDPAGERRFAYWRGSSAARNLFQVDGKAQFATLEDMDIIYLSAITLAILPPEVRAALLAWITEFRTRGGQFVFDSNYRPKLWEDAATARTCIDAAWSICDIALPSIDDEFEVFGETKEADVLKRFQGYGCTVAVLKRGAAGPLNILDPFDGPKTYPAAKTVVDTTAAGDSFSGAFLAEYIQSRSVTSAMLAGHLCALEVVQHAGAIIPKRPAY